mmetsp:Transcript_73543/g.192902  ORF Transcript_73543/g.192902 Transcript_73543/m.192902 type:complete len:182 (-) Transcript_73543:121-666(-)
MKARAVQARAAGARAGRTPSALPGCGRLLLLVLLQAAAGAAAAELAVVDAQQLPTATGAGHLPPEGDAAAASGLLDVLDHAASVGRSMLAEPLLLVSFMALRGAIALRSVNDKAPTIMWQGLGIALASRCVAAGALDPYALARLPDMGVQDLAAVGAGALREFLHIYGLTAILRNYRGGCG